MMRFYNLWVQHISNPLHIYCRLVDFGVSIRFSKKIGMIYEKYIYLIFMKDIKPKWKWSGKKF